MCWTRRKTLEQYEGREGGSKTIFKSKLKKRINMCRFRPRFTGWLEYQQSLQISLYRSPVSRSKVEEGEKKWKRFLAIQWEQFLWKKTEWDRTCQNDPTFIWWEMSEGQSNEIYGKNETTKSNKTIWKKLVI